MKISHYKQHINCMEKLEFLSSHCRWYIHCNISWSYLKTRPFIKLISKLSKQSFFDTFSKEQVYVLLSLHMRVTTFFPRHTMCWKGFCWCGCEKTLYFQNTNLQQVRKSPCFLTTREVINNNKYFIYNVKK